MTKILWVVPAVIALVGAPAAVSAQNERYGIHTYYLSPYLAEKSRDLGAGYVRI